MMDLVEGLLLAHGDQPYDPAKAHEYYVKYRKLHPRQAAAPRTTSFTIKTTNGKTVRLSSQQLEEQKVYAAHRVAQIKTKLSDLNVALHKKLAAAAAAEAKAKKPPTAAEKAQAAKDAKQYRNKHQQELANKSKSSKSGGGTTPAKKPTTVASLKSEIVTTKNNLKAAVAKQRELTAAKKNG